MLMNGFVSHQSMQLDQPLDDLVQKARKERSSVQRRGRGGQRRGGGGAFGHQALGHGRRGGGHHGGVGGVQQQQAVFGGMTPRAPSVPGLLPVQSGEGKIVVSNLPEDVSEVQIRVSFLFPSSFLTLFD
jgi:hypothetical protein